MNLWKHLTHNSDGTPSSTKFWQMVGYVISSCIMIWLTVTNSMSGEYFLIYLGALTASRGFQNYLVAKGKTTGRYQRDQSSRYPRDLDSKPPGSQRPGEDLD